MNKQDYFWLGIENDEPLNFVKCDECRQHYNPREHNFCPFCKENENNIRKDVDVEPEYIIPARLYYKKTKI